MSDRSLSVCILARNEKANIREAILSVREIADEVLVTDTGSTDATREIAAKAGATVDEWPWRDDFGAARNHQLEIARSAWVLLLDADERLVPGSDGALRNALECDREIAFQILRRDLQQLNRPDYYTEMTQLRLIRRVGGPRFIGRCHCQPRGEHAGRDFPVCEMRLLHHGYVQGVGTPGKLERLERTLELELAERPNQLYYEIELSRTLLLKGDAKAGRTLLRAARLLSEYLDSPSPPMPHAALLLEQLVQLPAARLPVPYTPELVAALCERWFPTSPPLLWLRAGIDFSAGRWSAAAEKLRCLVGMGRTGDYPRYTSFDPAIIGDEAALNLAACEIRIGRPAIAEKLLRPLLGSARVGAQARRNLEVASELKRLR